MSQEAATYDENTTRSPKIRNIEGLIGHCAALCLDGKWLKHVGFGEAALATPFLPFKNTLKTEPTAPDGRGAGGGLYE